MDPKSTRSSRSRLTTLGALVFVLLVSLFGALEYSQVSSLQSQNRTLSSSVVSYSSELKTFTHYQTKLEAANAQQLEDTCAGEGCDLIQGSNSSALSQAWLLHLAKLEEFDIQGAVEDYAPNATMIWVGDTQGLGGTYNGSNLEFALQVFPGGSNSFSLAIQSFQFHNSAEWDRHHRRSSRVYGVKQRRREFPRDDIGKLPVHIPERHLVDFARTLEFPELHRPVRGRLSIGGMHTPEEFTPSFPIVWRLEA